MSEIELLTAILKEVRYINNREVGESSYEQTPSTTVPANGKKIIYEKLRREGKVVFGYILGSSTSWTMQIEVDGYFVDFPKISELQAAGAITPNDVIWAPTGLNAMIANYAFVFKDYVRIYAWNKAATEGTLSDAYVLALLKP